MIKFSFSRDKRGLSLVVVCLILLFLFNLFFEIFFGRREYRRSPQHACYGNMHVLQNAVEMYNMDCTPMMQNLNVGILLKKGYLKKIPVCPEEKKFLYASVGDLSDDGQVFCYIHGSPFGELNKTDLKLFNNDSQKSGSLTPNRKRLIYAVLGSIICSLGMIFALSGCGKKKKELHEDQSEDQSENQPEDFAEAPPGKTSEKTSEDIME